MSGTTASVAAADGEVEVNTVDRYQGRDKDCVIISFVKSNPKNHVSISDKMCYMF